MIIVYNIILNIIQLIFMILNRLKNKYIRNIKYIKYINIKFELKIYLFIQSSIIILISLINLIN